ncbi:hypothetical protein NKDENANG_02005 [Candidatus Entotheonellaceae bacterium PAL068K]
MHHPGGHATQDKTLNNTFALLTNPNESGAGCSGGLEEFVTWVRALTPLHGHMGRDST